jgi:hypothetical protein
MGKTVIIFFLLSFLCSVSLYPQDGSDSRSYIINGSTDAVISPTTADQNKRIAVLKNKARENSIGIKSPLLDYQFHTTRPQHVEERSRFNIVSSFRENIKFGGYWDRYAIINFTPSVNIKPFDFISINASQTLSCFVPIDGIKEHFKILSIQGAAILAVDNTFKLIFGPNKIIQPLIGFAMKLLITSIAMKYVNIDSKYRMYIYNSYSYSMHISF